MKTKTKEWTYHKGHSFVDVEKNIKVNMSSQLYEASGVYGAITIDGKLVQVTFTPSQMVKNEKHLKKQQDTGVIKDLVLSGKITVYKDKDGFFKEKQNEN